MKQETEIWRGLEFLRQSLPKLPEPVAKPFLILVCGLPGTGKSSISSRLVEKLPLVVLETDALRKTLFPTPIYTADESGHLFMVAHLLVEELLTKGVPVLFDATNLTERHREYLYSIADRLKAKLVIILATAPRELVRHRLSNRSEYSPNGYSSDADWEVYKKMSGSLDAIRRNHLVVDTSKDVGPVIEKVVREIEQWTTA